MKKDSKKNYKKLIPLVFLIIILSLSYAQKINLSNSDIGRHIKNGEIFFNEGKILSTNFYSYTENNYPTITHHWGYGAIAYLIWKLTGFQGLSLINILIYLLSFMLFFILAKEKGDYKLAIFLTILLIPLIIHRKEIRPEVLSYFFLAFYYFLLFKFEKNKIKYKKLLLILIPTQIIWVNIHIFFIFGISIASFFTIHSYFNKKEKFKKYLILLGGLILASLINPFFIKGLLEPLLIFREYGYLLAENMSIIFMQTRFYNPLYLYFELIFLLGTISFFISKKTIKENVLNILLFLFFGTLAWKMTRNITIFGLVLIPILSENLKSFYNKLTKKQILKIISISIVIIITFIIAGLNYFSLNPSTGIGLLNNNLNSITFFKENNLEGPIFNNYDIGGYLILNLFPKEKVFVDNRPEAYSVKFFKEVYIPIQENKEVWKKYEKKYNLNIIYFYRKDMTPWGQQFLIERLKDPTWIPIYVDDFVIIYIKNSKENREIIEKFKIPNEKFKISKN